MRPFILCLYFICERKFYTLTHVKITRQWKYTLRVKILGNTNLVASRQFNIEKGSLPVTWVSQKCRCLNSLLDSTLFIFDSREILRAAVRKYRLRVCKMKNSKIPKLCQNMGLAKLFLEKLLLVPLEFYFRRTATESVRRLSDRFSQAQDHILLQNRLKIKEVTNSASENLNRKDKNLNNSFDVKFSCSRGNLIFFGFLI